MKEKKDKVRRDLSIEIGSEYKALMVLFDSNSIFVAFRLPLGQLGFHIPVEIAEKLAADLAKAVEEFKKQKDYMSFTEFGEDHTKL